MLDYDVYYSYNTSFWPKSSETGFDNVQTIGAKL